MLKISGNISGGTINIGWSALEIQSDVKQVEIEITLDGEYTQKKARKLLQERLVQNDVSWLSNITGRWQLNFDRLKECNFVRHRYFQNTFKMSGGVDIDIDSDPTDLSYLSGTVDVDLEIQLKNDGGYDGGRYTTSIIINLTETEMMERKAKKIFLSHKGADKEIVRRYNSTLKTLGFSTWLDEEAMVAGTEINRAILDGFKQSCAAIFFITSNYKDAAFLKTEISYAITERREKGDRFQIITIVLPEHHDKYEIPLLLQDYIWKMPKTHLEGLEEIIKALPITLGEPTFKELM